LRRRYGPALELQANLAKAVLACDAVSPIWTKETTRNHKISRRLSKEETQQSIVTDFNNIYDGQH
jgi:hypothetical protein